MPLRLRIAELLLLCTLLAGAAYCTDEGPPNPVAPQPEEAPFSRAPTGLPIREENTGVAYCRFVVKAVNPEDNSEFDVALLAYNRLHVLDGKLHLQGFVSATALGVNATKIIQRGDAFTRFKGQLWVAGPYFNISTYLAARSRAEASGKLSTSRGSGSASTSSSDAKDTRRLQATKTNQQGDVVGDHDASMDEQDDGDEHGEHSGQEDIGSHADGTEQHLPLMFKLTVGVMKHGHRANLLSYRHTVVLPPEHHPHHSKPSPLRSRARQVLLSSDAASSTGSRHTASLPGSRNSSDSSSIRNSNSSSSSSSLRSRFTLLLQEAPDQPCHIDLAATTNHIDYRGHRTWHMPPALDTQDKSTSAYSNYYTIALLQPPFSITAQTAAKTLVPFVRHYNAIGFHATVMYLRDTSMHEALVALPSVQALLRSRMLWFILIQSTPLPSGAFPAEFQRQHFSHFFLATRGMRVFVFPIDMDEYLVAPSGSPAFSIHDILDKCNPSRSSDLVFARDNIRCLTCPDIQLEAWDKLDEGTHPMTLFDGKAGPIDPWANRTNEARVKSMVNANCARTFYVHGATLHKHLKGCSTHKVHRSCAYVAHMRSLFANRGKNRRYGQTDEWKGYIERVQALWTERMLNNTYSVSQLPT